MSTAGRKFKNENSRLFRSSRDWGWMFSNVLMDRVIARTGMSRREVERLFQTIGVEMRELLVTGNPVGFPKCPVVYMRRSGRRVFNRKVYDDVVRARIWTSDPFRLEMQSRTVDRGDIRAQYDRERNRVTGFKGLAFKPRKQRTVGSGNRR